MFGSSTEPGTQKAPLLASHHQTYIHPQRSALTDALLVVVDDVFSDVIVRVHDGENRRVVSPSAVDEEQQRQHCNENDAQLGIFQSLRSTDAQISRIE